MVALDLWCGWCGGRVGGLVRERLMVLVVLVVCGVLLMVRWCWWCGWWCWGVVGGRYCVVVWLVGRRRCGGVVGVAGGWLG